MINFEVDITTMTQSSNFNNITYYITGMYRNTTEWDTSYKLIVTSLGANSIYLNLPVYFMKKEKNEDYISLYIGNYDTTTKKCNISWPYINAVIKNVQVSYWSNNSFYNTLKNKKWIVSITPDLQINEQQIQKATTVIPKTGNAASATKLETGRTLKVDLTSTSVSTAFDGTAAINDIGVDGVLSIANGGTGATTATEGLYNLQGISNITASANIPSYISTATFGKTGTVATFNIEISEATSNTSGLMSINDKINLEQNTTDNGKVQHVRGLSDDGLPLLFSTTSTPTSGMKDVVKYNDNLRYIPNEKKLYTGSLLLTGNLEVANQAYFSSDTTFYGQITTNSLLIRGEAIAQTPSAAQHIATKGYVDNAISQGFAANDAMVFKGTVTATSGFTTILSQTYSAGWTYRADGSFFLSSNSSNRVYYVEPGDLIIATQDKGYNGSINDWIVVEHNIDGGLYKSSTTFTDGAILLADGVAGKVKTGAITTTTVVTNIEFSAPTLGTAISADDITEWKAGNSTTAEVKNGVLQITIGTKPSLSYTSRSIPNITNVGNITSTTTTVVASIS